MVKIGSHILSLLLSLIPAADRRDFMLYCTNMQRHEAYMKRSFQKDVHDAISNNKDAFIYLADTAAGINEKIKERICEPFFTIKTDNGKSLGLPIAYRIIKEPGRSIRGENQWGQGEANIYLPLTRQEIVNMMSIPVGVSYGR